MVASNPYKESIRNQSDFKCISVTELKIIYANQRIKDTSYIK